MTGRRGSAVLLAAVTLISAAVVELPAVPARALSTAPDATWMVKGSVYALAEADGVLYVGGRFAKVLDEYGVFRYRVNNVAAFDEATGQGIPTFAPSFTSAVTTARVDALAVQDGYLYVGGNFTTCGGVDGCRNLARVDISTGTVDPSFQPLVGKVNTAVHTIVTDGDIYLGGSFRAINGTYRQRIGAVTTDGTVTAWNPRADGVVRGLDMSPTGTTIYAAGHFSTMKGSPRQSLAEIDLATGLPTSWNPGVNIEVDMTCWDTVPRVAVVYAACGASHNYYAAYDAITGNQIWRHGAGGNVVSAALANGDTIEFISGHFGTRDPESWPCGYTYLHGIAKVDPTTGEPDCSFDPVMLPDEHNRRGGWTLLVVNGHLWVGGKFYSLGGVGQQGVARFTL